MSRYRRDLAALDRATRAAKVRRNPEDTHPAIARAQRTLNRAFAELDGAQHAPDDAEARSEAAEKAWRGAREAVYGVIEAYTGERPRGTIGAGEVANIEARHLQRPCGQPGGQPLTDGYVRAERELHGRYFRDCLHDAWGVSRR